MTITTIDLQKDDNFIIVFRNKHNLPVAATRDQIEDAIGVRQLPVHNLQVASAESSKVEHKTLQSVGKTISMVAKTKGVLSKSEEWKIQSSLSAFDGKITKRSSSMLWDYLESILKRDMSAGLKHTIVNFMATHSNLKWVSQTRSKSKRTESTDER